MLFHLVNLPFSFIRNTNPSHKRKKHFSKFMPSDTYFTRVVDDDGIIQVRKVVIVEAKQTKLTEKKGNEGYRNLFAVYHAYKDPEGVEHSTSLKISEREEDGKVFLSVFKEDARITITLSKQELAELYAVLTGYITKNYG